jgi:arabinofuranosyltransferase
MPSLSSLARWAPVLVICALWAAHAAWFYWVCDDAFISFRYARQLLDGHGLVFNPGERVEGYTNLLWVLEVALLGALHVPMPLASVILSALCTLGCVWLVVQLLRSTPFVSMRSLAVASALLLLAVNRNVAVWTTSGLETRQFTFLVLLSIWLVRRALDRQSGWFAAALALGATELTRPEGGLVAVSIGAWVLWRVLMEGRGWRRPLLELAAPTAVIIVAHYVWRFAYYDDWLPNTAYAKVVRPWPDAGILYFGAALVQAGLYLSVPLALVGGSLRWLRRRDGLLGLSLFAILPHAAYIIAIGGDHFEFRPLDYYWPLLAVGVGDALGGLALWLRLQARRARAWQPRGTSVLVWSAALAALLTYSSILQIAQLVAEYPRRSKRDLAPEPPPRVTLASFPAGELLPGFETLVRAYQGSLDVLTSHTIAVSWIEHRSFEATLSGLYARYGRPDRAAFPAGAVMAHNWMGIIPFHLPEVTFIDRFGLTDKTIARHGSPANARRRMAHDRSPPPGYLESRGVNISIEPAAKSLSEALLLAPYAMELGADLWAPFSTERPEWLRSAPRPQRWYHLDWQRPERSVLAGQRGRSARLLLDCEAEPQGWTLSGARCVRRPGKGEGPVAQVEGKAWLSTYDPKRGDAASAEARSPAFAGGSNTFLMFKLGGGAGNGVRVALRDASGRELGSYRGANDQTLRAVLVDLRPYDRELHLELSDAESGSWGHLLLDAVALVEVDSLPNEASAVSRQDASR